MKEYIKPALDTYTVQNQAMLADSDLKIEIDNNPINGPVGAKSANDFEFGDED